MNKKKIMLVFGTRPEAIKMCPLVNELKSRESLETIVCVTGQHRQMLDQVLNTFNVVPDYDLSIMKQGQTLFDITIGILEKLKEVLEEVKPDVVLVHGDTSTTFVTALACFYLQIPVGHVEAGLRTYNIYSPYPEEFNRQVVGIISQYNFAPTQMAADNLMKEGKDPSKIFITGNTVIDAMQHTVKEDYSHPELDWVGDGKLIFIIRFQLHQFFQRKQSSAIRQQLSVHRPEIQVGDGFQYFFNTFPCTWHLLKEVFKNRIKVGIIKAFNYLIERFDGIILRKPLRKSINTLCQS